MKHKGSGLSPSPDNIFRLIGRYCSSSRTYLRKIPPWHFFLCPCYSLPGARASSSSSSGFLLKGSSSEACWSFFCFSCPFKEPLFPSGFHLRSLTRDFRSASGFLSGSWFSFQSRIDTWAEDLLTGLGTEMCCACFSNKHCSLSQFQSAWKQTEIFFARIHFWLEDVPVLLLPTLVGSLMEAW